MDKEFKSGNLKGDLKMELIGNKTQKELLKILIREDARRSKLEIAGSGKALREALENIAFLSRKLESGV